MGKWNGWRKPKGNAGSRRGIDNRDNVEKMGNTENQEQGNGLDSAVDTLITAILGCEEYLAYRAELDKVLQNPELKSEIDNYRRRNYELQTSADIDFDKLDRFEKEYENFRSDPLVSDFLAAELAFCKRMQEIETSITARLDFQ